MSTIAFISGHRDLTGKEFIHHYQKELDRAINDGCCFVVGDAPGADVMAQRYLKRMGVEPSRVTVYHLGILPRNNVGFCSKGGFTFHSEKDAAMTAASGFDIAWARDGRTTSGTAKNIERRSKSTRTIYDKPKQTA